jgi:hypothetical protein
LSYFPGDSGSERSGMLFDERPFSLETASGGRAISNLNEQTRDYT